MKQSNIMLSLLVGLLGLAPLGCEMEQQTVNRGQSGTAAGPTGDDANEKGTDNGTSDSTTTQESTKPLGYLELTWDAIDAAEDVAKITVHMRGEDDDELALLDTVDVTAEGFDLASPKVKLTVTPGSQLAKHVGKRACFRIKAISSESLESDPSAEVCAQLGN